jgi:outer membrane protein TolC
MTRPLIPLFILLLSTVSVAQDPVQLTFTDCLAIAREQSTDAINATLTYKEAAMEYKAFRRSLYPQVSLAINSPGYSKSFSAINLDAGNRDFLLQQNAYSTAGLNLAQSIPWTGGSILVGSSIEQIYSFGDFESRTWVSSPVYIQYNQPLFQFNAWTYDIPLEDLQMELAKIDFSEAMEQVAIETTERFFRVMRARASLNNALLNQTINDTIFQISKGRFQIGKIAENDLLQSELKAMNARSEVLSARLEMQQAQKALILFLNLDQGHTLQLVYDEQIPQMNFSPEAAVDRAMENKKAQLEKREEKLNAERSYASSMSALGLSADLSASFGYNQRAGIFADVYKDPRDRQYFNVSLQFPLLTWGRQTASAEAALARRTLTENQLPQDRQENIDRIYFSAINVNQLRDRVLFANRSDTIATRRFEVAKNRYLIGKIDITDLFIAQSEKDVARQNVYSTLSQYWAAYYRLRQNTLYDFVADKHLLER